MSPGADRRGGCRRGQCEPAGDVVAQRARAHRLARTAADIGNVFTG